MLIFLDIETTGLEQTDKMVSIALLNPSTKEYKYELVNESKKISAEASSIHHITNEMIKDKPAFTKSEVYKYLQKHNSEENVLVAHNSKFALGILSSFGFMWQGGVIDTLRTTKHLIPECELFSLQVLRYELRLYKKEEALKKEYGIKDALFAHHPLNDTIVVELLFEYLKDMASVDAMQVLSNQNVLLEKLNFGKHKGGHIEEIAHNDRAYLEWMLNSLSDLDDDLKYSINYYLQG
jgi:DNA polymerase-3 subunit epsilon/exodeoxyribonuclease X